MGPEDYAEPSDRLSQITAILLQLQQDVELGQTALQRQTRMHGKQLAQSRLATARIQRELEKANNRKWFGRITGFGVGVGSSLVATEISGGRATHWWERAHSLFSGSKVYLDFPMWWLLIPTLLILLIIMWTVIARLKRKSEQLVFEKRADFEESELWAPEPKFSMSESAGPPPIRSSGWASTGPAIASIQSHSAEDVFEHLRSRLAAAVELTKPQ